MSAETPLTRAADGNGAEASPSERWSQLPRYLHFFTLGYFATNFFNIWAYGELAPHAAVSIMATIGFVGGLAEHITPYFPRLTIPVMAEKILFRVPTILASVLVFYSLDPWLPWSLLILGWAIYFWRAPGLSSLELGFHLRHFGITHVGGTCATLAWLMVHDGGFPFVTGLYTAPFG